MSQNNISQVDLGNHVGKSKGTVNSWIKRDVIPPGDITYKIATLLKTSVQFLVTGSDPDDECTSDIRRKFQKYINESSDEALQKIWDYFELMWGDRK